MQKINPFLWFNNQAEEAVKFYVSAFSSVFDSQEVILIQRS
jgi:predicted 3-demethylubiquinone-9 3-methyltransferase (glyoxalase superfamily)